MHEGVVPAPYLDSVSVWTFGVGHTAAAGAPFPSQMPRGMPSDLDAALRQVFSVFSSDIERYEAAVRKALKIPVYQHEFDALVSFHFNTGAIGKATLVKRLNAGDRSGAASGFSSWHKPAEIIERRRAERDLFALGAYPDGVITVWSVTTSGKVILKPFRTLTSDQAIAMIVGKTPDGQSAPAPAAPYSRPVVSVKTIGPSSHVAALQRALGISADGIFGAKTRAHVFSFQKSKGLTADGIVGPKTWAALGL